MSTMVTSLHQSELGTGTQDLSAEASSSGVSWGGCHRGRVYLFGYLPDPFGTWRRF